MVRTALGLAFDPKSVREHSKDVDCQSAVALLGECKKRACSSGVRQMVPMESIREHIRRTCKLYENAAFFLESLIRVFLAADNASVPAVDDRKEIRTHRGDLVAVRAYGHFEVLVILVS